MNAPQSLIVPCQIGSDHEAGSGMPTSAALCHQCGEALELCQPRPENPDELLGVCQCGAWHYIAFRPDRSEVLVAYLPLGSLSSVPDSSAKTTGEAPSEGQQPPRSQRQA